MIMNNEICYVVGAGDNYGLDFTPTESDYVIAADGGLHYLKQANILPNLIIGDFDSLGYCPEQQNVIKLSTEKDDTDMLVAVKEGIKKGFDVFYLFCGMGGRVEHTIANIQLLAFLSQSGKQGFLFGKECVLTTITDTTLELSAENQGYISVFSYSEKSDGVCLQGLKYELDNEVITNTFPVGASNEFTGAKSFISVENGTLLIVFPKQKTGGFFI